MKAWVKYTVVLIVVVAIVVAVSIYFTEEKTERTTGGWSEDGLGYSDNYLWCIQSKTGMPAAYFPEAVALMRCTAERLANRTDGIVDVIDIRACEVTYMIDEGYYPGNYTDACAALRGWESTCKVPETYVFDCSEIVDFVNANHEDIKAVIDECSA